MSKLLALTVLVLGSGFPAIVLGASFETPSIRLSYPDTYKHVVEKNTTLLIGPSGEQLRVSVFSGNADAALTKIKAHMERFGSHGDLVFIRPVTEGKHHTGTPMYTSASYVGSRSYYFLQYASAKTNALVYLTFEGVGDLDEAAKAADEIVKSLEWK